MQQSFILTAFLIASASASSVIRRDDTTKSCFEYDTRDPTKATCDSRPDQVCTKGCTGGVVSQNCTIVPLESWTPEQYANNKPVSSVTCNKSFGKSSAISYRCNTDHGDYYCSGPSTGSATCSGCVSNGVQLGNVSATTPPADNSTMSGSNSTSTPDANATSPDTSSPDATKPSGAVATGTASANGSSSGTGGSGSPSGAQWIATGSMVSACTAAFVAGIASIIV